MKTKRFVVKAPSRASVARRFVKATTNLRRVCQEYIDCDGQYDPLEESMKAAEVATIAVLVSTLGQEFRRAK